MPARSGSPYCGNQLASPATIDGMVSRTGQEDQLVIADIAVVFRLHRTGVMRSKPRLASHSARTGGRPSLSQVDRYASVGIGTRAVMEGAIRFLARSRVEGEFHGTAPDMSGRPGGER